MMNRNILNPMMWNTEGPTPPPTDYGVYWNQDLGLLSYSSDGEEWITMADKNLGATQVYNYGDTLSQANCGDYFQRGNNYGFPWTGSVPTSSTTVYTGGNGPYYESSTFITGNQWSSGFVNLNLWGGVTGTNRAKQGPSPNGYHIPSSDEYVSLVNTMTALGIDTSNGNCMKIYLKMPFAGFRDNSSSNPTNQDALAGYWTASADTEDYYSLYYSYYIYFDSSQIYTQEDAYRCYGLPIRCFKNEPEMPTETWRTLFDGPGQSGIYWDTEEGLISISSDGENRITIMDRNLGATIIYSDGDPLIQENCGNFYQWGNNYGFPFSGSVTTSSTKVVTQNYGPYYYDDTFVTKANWCGDNNNLWGYESGTLKARRGPAPDGFHVPDMTEMQKVILILTRLGISVGEGYQRYMKMPYAGCRNYTNSNPIDKDTYAYFWMSNGYSAIFRATSFTPLSNGAKGYGLSVRPFTNIPVAPDETRTKLF